MGRNLVTRWIIHLGRRRYVAQDAKIHPSVYERMKAVPDYRPANLPAKDA